MELMSRDEKELCMLNCGSSVGGSTRAFDPELSHWLSLSLLQAHAVAECARVCVCTCSARLPESR